MKVLCVNDAPPGGASGAEVHLEMLVEGLRAAGDEVDVFTGVARRGLARAADAWDPTARRTLEQHVRTARPDILHFHNVVRELSVSVLTAAPGVPRLLTVHDGRLLGDADGRGAALRFWQRRVRGPLDGRVARRTANLTLAVSQPLAQRLRAAGFRNVVEALPWARLPASPPLPAELSADVLYLGRLDVDKGVRVLLEAFRRATAEHPRARLLLAGDGALRPEVEQVAAEPDSRVVALGTLDRAAVSRALGTARVVVVPSLPARRPEGSPLALIEALVHGRPTVVSDDPGCAALVQRDPAAGLVVPAGDVRALAGALAAVLADDALVARLSAGAAVAASAHQPSVGLQQLRSCYSQVLSTS